MNFLASMCVLVKKAIPDGTDIRAAAPSCFSALVMSL